MTWHMRLSWACTGLRLRHLKQYHLNTPKLAHLDLPTLPHASLLDILGPSFSTPSGIAILNSPLVYFPPTHCTSLTFNPSPHLPVARTRASSWPAPPAPSRCASCLPLPASTHPGCAQGRPCAQHPTASHSTRKATCWQWRCQGERTALLGGGLLLGMRFKCEAQACTRTVPCFARRATCLQWRCRGERAAVLGRGGGLQLGTKQRSVVQACAPRRPVTHKGRRLHAVVCGGRLGGALGGACQSCATPCPNHKSPHMSRLNVRCCF